MIPESSWRAWKVPGITYAQAFHKWFPINRASFFEQSVAESARTGTEVQRAYYNNSIESQHFREKKEQSYKKVNVAYVM